MERVKLYALLVMMMCVLMHSQTVSSNIATITIARFFTTFEVESFREQMGSSLGITPSRVTVQMYYPSPLLNPDASETSITFLIFNEAGAPRLPLGSQALAYLRHLFIFRNVNSTLVDNGLVLTRLTIGEDPPPPEGSDGSGTVLGPDAIVLIIFGALLACALLGGCGAVVFFVFKIVKKTIQSHRHKRLDMDYNGNDSDFDSFDSEGSSHSNDSQTDDSDNPDEMEEDSMPTSSGLISSSLGDDSEPDSDL